MSIDLRKIYNELGRPLICVPVVDDNIEDIYKFCSRLSEEPADIVEWRIDCYEECHDIEEVMKALEIIRENINNLPLICTFRTHHEGGGFIEDEEYYQLLEALSASGMTDIIDVEINRGSSDKIAGLIDSIRKDDVSVIASCHYFDRTPRDEVMKNIFARMSAAGADILKLAVMPDNRHDVIRLINVTEYASMIYTQPVVTMSMGRLGLASRMTGCITGSVMTFASAGKASAPGQIEAKVMKELLDILI